MLVVVVVLLVLLALGVKVVVVFGASVRMLRVGSVGVGRWCCVGGGSVVSCC